MSRPPTILGRLATSASLIVLVGTACGSLPHAEFQVPQGRTFVAMVPDSVDDVGLHPSIDVSDDGVPYITYFGFPGELAEGEIPVSRPIGAPYLTTEEGDDAGAVLLASVTPDTQIWNRGAVAQPRETPAGVTVPFGPAAEPPLRSLRPATAKGADVEVSGSDIHVAWTSDTGVWYGAGPDFEVATVEETREGGAPAIALDDAGSPLVAYAVGTDRPEIRLAELTGEQWRATSITTLAGCEQECPPSTQIAVVGGEPLIVVADPQSGELLAAHRQGAAWSTEVIATDAVGGVSLAASEDEVTVSFYTDSGVAIATGSPGSWSIDDVAEVGDPAEGGATGPTTGVAVDGAGRVWVAWEDASGVHLASSGENGSHTEEELQHTEGGVTPTVGVTEDGSAVYLAWYDTEHGDLRTGISTEITDLLIAAPSPTPPVAITGPEDCGDDPEPILDISAQTTAFNTQCLVGPAEDPFTVTFDNQDTTQAHNWSLYEDAEYSTPIVQEDTFLGPATEEYPVPPLEEQEYFFRCDAHPLQMTGVLAVVVEGGGGGGGGGGGQGDGGGSGGGGGGG